MASVLWKFSSFRTFKWEILSSFSAFSVRKFSNLPENSFLSTHKRYYTNWDNDENEANETINRNLWRNAIPKYAQIVICGASSVGNAIAYNLLKKGWTDVVVMEKGRIGETLSSIGNNIISTFNSSTDGIITQYNIDLFEELKTGGYDIGWKSWGAIDIARTKDRMIYFQRLADEAKIYGLEFEIIGPEDIKKICPLVNTEDLEGGLWKETDSVADPTKLCLAIADLARKEGAQYFEECQVLRILTENGRVTGVQTNFGITECEYLVVCAGMNTRELGQKCIPPFRVPIHFTDLPFIITQPVHGIIPSLPIIRDYDGKFFCHKYDQGILIGGYFNEMKSRFCGDSENKTLELSDIMPLYNEAKQRLPILSQVDIDQMVKVSYSFTPDGQWIAGKTPEINNLFVTGGSNGNSLQAVGGLGRALANWISNTEPDSFMLPFDICRFIDVHNNYKFLQERVAEVVELGYTIPHPLPKEFNTARTLRCSPLYTIQDDAGAVFGERMGFERALYFDKTKSREERLCPPPTSFGKPPWFDIVRDEYIACRERVGLIDMSSFTKSFIMSAGTEVVNFLQLLCSNDVDIPVGCIVPTGMQNEKGGYENDCLLVRRANNCYFMISPTSQQTRLGEWMEKNLPTDGSISFNDVTSMYTVLNVVGPKSKELMTELTKTNMSIPSFTCKEMNVGYASEVMVMGFNNTGEPGYTLYVPSEYALHVYDRLATVGRDFGIKNVGYYTLRFLRIEKFIPFWGEELDSNTTPLEVGRSFKVKMQKNYFLGKVALQHQIDKGLFRRLVHFQLENHNPDTDLWPWGREPIFRNGKYVGTTTSSGYGFTLNKVVCLGFVDNFNRMSHKYEVVTNDYITKDAKFEVSIAGKRYVAKPSLHSPKIPIVTMSGTTRYTPRAVNGV
ncbi:pyruvate dehydrogenase phosphatase regulatory subunit, mitochondrial-like [Centruroides vittatus]|uniref:pyruvate dehydrogenase phosphatase regulatory subunit, mitochondrial-like n=1 Tax=Centruroides vittatus TaxID=120091 RepID=UPI003510968E